METAIELGYTPLKMNCVLMRCTHFPHMSRPILPRFQHLIRLFEFDMRCVWLSLLGSLFEAFPFRLSLSGSLFQALSFRLSLHLSLHLSLSTSLSPPLSLHLSLSPPLSLHLSLSTSLSPFFPICHTFPFVRCHTHVTLAILPSPTDTHLLSQGDTMTMSSVTLRSLRWRGPSMYASSSLCPSMGTAGKRISSFPPPSC